MNDGEDEADLAETQNSYGKNKRQADTQRSVASVGPDWRHVHLVWAAISHITVPLDQEQEAEKKWREITPMENDQRSRGSEQQNVHDSMDFKS